MQFHCNMVRKCSLSVRFFIVFRSGLLFVDYVILFHELVIHGVVESLVLQMTFLSVIHLRLCWNFSKIKL